MSASADNTFGRRNACFVLLLAVVVAFGISCGSDETLTVKDTATGQPLEGIRVERHRPVSRTEKVFNPVGAFYHPHRLADTKSTDARGQVAFSGCDLKDIFRFQNRCCNALTVALGGREIQLSPGANQISNGGWGASVWIENGVVKQSVWPLKDKEATQLPPRK